ncbi:MAG: dephospho-CoA kinase [Hydrogenophaga sp.]|nr:dephospho-CoA kinase [Hydrogenophaga sp.]
MRLGLTGGIGSGKSTAGARLQALGADLIDADAISRRSTAAGGPAIESIRKAFGDAFIDNDGALNREAMRALVFRDPTARQRLESIVHPIVAQGISEHVRASRAPCIVFDVPLLVESPRWRTQLDRVLVVDCSEATQLRRVRARSGWDDATVHAVIRQQASRAQRLSAADLVIFNDEDDLDRLHTLIDRLSPRFGL